MIFGVHPGPPGDPARIAECLDALQGDSRPFVVRPANPAECEQYAAPGRLLDLALQYRSASGDIAGYLDFVRASIERHHPKLYSVQITQEANSAGGPELRRALVEGVVAAKDCLRALGRPEVLVGFNSAPTFGPAAEFWRDLRHRHPRFLDCLDYVGLDCFPDVFRPARGIAEVVTGLLETMRAEWLTTNGFPESIPVHITEHGWPTSAGRSWERQADVIETVVRTAHSEADAQNIGRYMLFSLRDAGDSFFGVMTEDYRPKPAFERLRALIAELGAR